MKVVGIMGDGVSLEVLKLTKIEVAERQLRIAIKIYFEEKDEPVSVHTLASAALKVLSDMSSSLDGTSSIMDRLVETSRVEDRRETIRKIREYRNYFNHADRDKDVALEFKSYLNDYYLFDAVNLYQQITKNIVDEFLVFQLWFYLQHKEIYKGVGSVPEIIEDIEQIEQIKWIPRKLFLSTFLVYLKNRKKRKSKA
jgi:hypothetical protein